MQHLDNLGLDHMKVAVNLSPVQFLQPQLISRTFAILEECNFEPSRLELEITETTMMTNLQEGVHKLNQLVDQGISISIDDFGTGYSSLYYLKNLPIDTIKIDQTFIRDITHDFNDAQIVETIILMAKNLGIGVVAEGVETAEQLELLSRFHCEQVQGHYFSRPLLLEELVEYLYQRESETSLGN
jgi:EAL domain-containing protein (putative c-di-GMP-specific phosphodiesterase class I)